MAVRQPLVIIPFPWQPHRTYSDRAGLPARQLLLATLNVSLLRSAPTFPGSCLVNSLNPCYRTASSTLSTTLLHIVTNSGKRSPIGIIIIMGVLISNLLLNWSLSNPAGELWEVKDQASIKN